ncbi:transposase [Burkholderia glumae]|nr:transposase [Burkholderia glumae]
MNGRRRTVDDRAALNGILYVLQTHVAWEDVPQEPGFGSGMTCWRRRETGKRPVYGIGCIWRCCVGCVSTARSSGQAEGSAGASRA